MMVQLIPQTEDYIIELMLQEIARQQEMRQTSPPMQLTSRREAPIGISQPVRWAAEEPQIQPEPSAFRLSERMPTMAPPQAPPQAMPPPTAAPPVMKPPVIEPEVLPVEEEISVPFWKRALQIFAAPFQWVDEYVIQPGLALMGTTLGFVQEVEREPGEDFWEWKKRSWAGWQAPGIELNVPWSDDPWRIDIKGVMEVAPWLLIPGAGQVGVGAKAARGIAGLVGKVAKPLGYAVEYSPWGLVEKTAGVAIKGGVRAVGKVSERVSTKVADKLFGKIPEPLPPTPTVAKVTKFMKEVVLPARKGLRELVPEQVTLKQEQAVQSVIAKYRRGEISYEKLGVELKVARGGVGIKGEFALTPKALAARQATAITDVEARVASGEITSQVGDKLIAKLRESPAYTAVPFKKAEVKEMLDMILGGAESGLVKADSATAFLELMTQGKLPFPHNIRDWALVFGDDFAKAVGQLGRTPKGFMPRLVDALNLPRATMASTDLSATLRQGLILSLLHPTRVPVWFGRQFKSLFSEKLALEMDSSLRLRPLFKKFTEAGGYIAPMKTEVAPWLREELFMSNLARRIPLVRRSERAFITYLNEARMTAFESGFNAMTAQGASPAHFKMLAEFINYASGRGNLPKAIEKYSPMLNAVLFSPRLQMATLQMPRQLGRMLLSSNSYMRWEAAKALGTFVGGGATLLGLLHLTGVKVEIDPRSGDFAKIKIGETRLDIWRGYAQYARLAAQMITGERKSAYGNMNKAQRDEIAFRFLQSKSSPALGLMVDLLRGETYMGEPIFSDTTGFTKYAREKLLPLAIQDVMDAMEQGGMNGLWVAAPATLGVGALTYVNDYVKVKEKIAREMGYKSWDEIDPKTQREIQNRNVELQAATIKFDRDVMGTAWGDWRLAGNAIEGIFKDNVDLAATQFRETGDGYVFREKVNDAFTARRGGYAAREKEARFEDIVKRQNVSDTLEALLALGPEQLAIRAYNEALYGDDMYDEFGDYRFDEADVRKAQLLQELGEEMFNYVEEFRGEKYFDFPAEYHELAKARKVLKPYWDVQEMADRYFGSMDSSQKSAFISRWRKRYKRNPTIAYYYNLFYARE